MIWKRVTSNVLTRLVLWLFFGIVTSVRSRRARRREKQRRRDREEEALRELNQDKRLH